MAHSSLITAYESFAKKAYPYIHITNESEYALALEEIQTLLETASDTLDDPLNPLIEMISNAIATYEAQDKELALFIEEANCEPADIALLRTLMKTHSLSGKDLPEVGDKTMVSKVLSQKRVLQRSSIEKLSARFGIRPALFFGG
jgi:HTH-type transcriptional regulator / antitoxin HigA